MLLICLRQWPGIHNIQTAGEPCLSASMAAMTSPDVERIEMWTATLPGLDCWLAWGSVASAPSAVGALVSVGSRRPDITNASGSPCGVYPAFQWIQPEQARPMLRPCRRLIAGELGVG